MSKDSPSKSVRVIGRVRDDVPGKRPRWFQEAAFALPEASVEGFVESENGPQKLLIFCRFSVSLVG
jgi:hypothetical protein